MIQWDSLESYFLSYFDLDDDLAKQDLNEKPSREKRLLKAFKDPVTKLYAMFVQSVIPLFDSYNTFLHAEEPLIHVLYQSTIRLYCSLLSRFTLSEKIASSDDVLDIDLDDPDCLKDYDSIFIRGMTKQYARSNDIIRTPVFKKFLKEVRNFYDRCAKYLQASTVCQF